MWNREHRKSRFLFWEQGKTPIFFRGTREQVLPGRASLIKLGFNDMSTLVDHFVSSPREREKRD